MSRSTEEACRPGEWLLGFEHDAGRYAALLRDAGSVAAAAWRLARARCRVAPVPSAVPTVWELWAAAGRLVSRAPDAELPSRDTLADECEALELPVIGPMRARYAA